MKLNKGDIMPDFTFVTPFGSRKSLYQTIGQKPSFIMFLRYYGCTVCQLDLQNLKKNYGKFTERGGQVLIVLQSKPEGIAAQVSEEDLPFTIICDPEQELYRQFDIAPAKSTLGMLSWKLFGKLLEAKRQGIKHGAYEGNEQQLPAVFLINQEGRVEYVHYANNLTDLPDHERMIELLA